MRETLLREGQVCRKSDEQRTQEVVKQSSKETLKSSIEAGAFLNTCFSPPPPPDPSELRPPPHRSLPQHVSDGKLGVILHVAHVRLHFPQPVLVDELVNEQDASLVAATAPSSRSGYRQLSSPGATRVRVEKRLDALLLKHAARDQLKALMAAPSSAMDSRRGHGSRRDALTSAR